MTSSSCPGHNTIAIDVHPRRRAVIVNIEHQDRALDRVDQAR